MEKEKINEKCIGCKRITEDKTCEAYSNPDLYWIHRKMDCPLASHTINELTAADKKRVGQQKQKKKTRKK